MSCQAIVEMINGYFNMFTVIFKYCFIQKYIKENGSVIHSLIKKTDCL